MGASSPILKPNFRAMPYIALAGALMVMVPAFWVPFCFRWVAVGTVTGSVAFCFQWLGIRKRMNLGFVGLLFFLFFSQFTREYVLPRDVSHLWFSLYLSQLTGLFLFMMSTLGTVFRKRMKRDFEKFAA